jgi:uncharacterized repeat protein (TIGR01451 family)
MHKHLTLEALEERMLLSISNPASASDLITAINMANASGTPTTITLTPNINFDFANYDNSTNGHNALPVITGNITIVGNGSGLDNLKRTGMAAYRLFDVAIGGSLTLVNVAVQGGLAKGAGTAAEGGAVYSSGALTISGTSIQDNTAQGSNGASGVGGGPRGIGGQGAGALGGGLFVAEGSVSLTDDSLLSNNAKGGNGGKGGTPTNVGTHITGFIFDGGQGGAGGEAGGGGLFVAGGSVSLIDDIVRGNQDFGGNGGNGGNGFNDGGNGGFGGFGGGDAGGGVNVSAASSLTVVNDSFINNGTYGGFGGNGGNGGSAEGGGGGNGGNGAGAAGGGVNVFMPGGSVTLSKDTFSANGAFGGLGGLGGNGVFGSPGGSGGAGGNGAGGGVYVTASSITLINDTLSGNGVQGGFGGNGGGGGKGMASGLGLGGFPGGNGGGGGAGGAGTGAGLFMNMGSTTLINDTLALNNALGGIGGNGGGGGAGASSIFGGVPAGKGGDGGAGGAGQGGGLYVPAFNVTYGLANTLIAENNAAGSPGGSGGGGNSHGAKGSDGATSGPDVSGTVTSSDDDLIGNAGGSSGWSSNGDQLGTVTTPNPINPQLAPLANNGGPTDTMAELSNSPAIGKGDTSAVASILTDQRGYNRTVNNTVDIGAYESGSMPAATPAVSISGSGSSSTAPGGLITYTLIVTNSSSTAQRNVSLTDQLPANAMLVSWTPATGWSGDASPAGSSGGTATAWIASLAPDSSATFTLVVQVAASTPLHTVISNTVSIAPFADLTSPSANSASINTTVLYAPTIKVVDGGIYIGNPFKATATAYGTDGTTQVLGTFSFAYYVGTGTTGLSLGSTAPTDANTYTVVATFTSNNSDYSGGSAQLTFTIAQATTDFSNLTMQQIVTGTTTVLLASQLTSNTIVPVNQSVAISLNGLTQPAVVGMDGSFSVSFDTSAFAVGTYTISYNYAGDQNFTAASASGSLTVAYGSQLLFNNNKPVHSGAVLPVKLALTDASGADISSADIAVTAVGLVDSNGNPVPLNAAGDANPNDLFRYDASLGGYIFNLSTAGLSAGTYTLYYTAGNDPTRHSLTFVVD